MRAIRRTRLPGKIDDTSVSGAAVPLTIDDCILWLDATRISGYEDDDYITTWEDLSTSGLDVSEVSNRPKYKTSGINSMPAVQFGINSSTKLKSTISPTVTQFSLFIVCHHISYAVTYPIFFQQNNVNTGIVCHHQNNGDLIYRNPLGNQITIGSISVPRTMLFYFQHDSEIHAWLDGVEESSGGSAAVERTKTITLGNQESSGNQFNGYIGEIAWYDRALDSDEIAAMHYYLNNKWSIY